MRKMLALLSLTLTLSTPPARAELHGGIEIGGMGVKATVIDVTGDGDDLDIAIKLSDSTNTSLTTGVARTGKFAEDAVTDTAKAVKKYRERMAGEFMVPPANIHVVGSSGLFAAIADKEEQIRENKRTLLRAVLKETGVSMDFITVKQESELSIAGTLPKSRRAKGILVDIGSGNTKGGVQVGPGEYATFGVPFGTVTFAEYARKQNVGPKDFAKLCAKAVAPPLRDQLITLPGLEKRDHVYLSGGTIWAVATLARPSDAKAYTPLTLKDVEDLEVKLLAHPDKLPEPDLSGITNDKQRARAAAEIARVRKTYPPERLLAGVAILKSIFRELEGDKRTFTFARHGQIGWILAYVTETATKP
jgi:exopolyphosphatase/pppGpp-phosphohydrolase